MISASQLSTVLDTTVAVQSATTVFMVTSQDLKKASSAESSTTTTTGGCTSTPSLSASCPFVVKVVGHGTDFNLMPPTSFSEVPGGNEPPCSLSVKCPRMVQLETKSKNPQHIKYMAIVCREKANLHWVGDRLDDLLRFTTSSSGKERQKLAESLLGDEYAPDSSPNIISGGVESVKKVRLLQQALVSHLRLRLPTDVQSLILQPPTGEEEDTTPNNWIFMPYLRGCQLQRLFFSDEVASGRQRHKEKSASCRSSRSTIHREGEGEELVDHEYAPSGLNVEFIVHCVLKQLIILLEFLHTATIDVEVGTVTTAHASSSHPSCMVYRDLKLSNVHIDPYCRVKLVDLGSAIVVADNGAKSTDSKEERENAARSSSVAGMTSHIRPPEMYSAGADSPLSPSASLPTVDVWQLGALLHELVFKKPVFGGDDFSGTAATLGTSAVDATEFQNRLDSWKINRNVFSSSSSSPKQMVPLYGRLLDFMAQCLAVDPEQRFAVEEEDYNSSSGRRISHLWATAKAHTVFDSSSASVATHNSTGSGGIQRRIIVVKSEAEEEAAMASDAVEEDALHQVWLKQWYPRPSALYGEEISDQLLGL